MGQAPSRSFVPLLALAAGASAAIVLYAIGDWALAAGFAATVITIAALLAWYRHLYPPPLSAGDAVPDWTVARAAADASSMAIAVTDRAGRLVCASDLFGEWFPGYPSPPAVNADASLIESLTAAARAAWRDGCLLYTSPSPRD